MASNPLEELGVSDAELERALKSPEIQDAKRELAKKALAYWKSVSPEDEGDYIASLHIVERDDELVIRADAEHAHIVEYGTIYQAEAAPRAKVQAKFGREV